MGAIYVSCNKCGKSCGIQAQFIGNVNCKNCNNDIMSKGKGVPRFQTWEFECKKCNFSISFEGMHCTNVSCVTDNEVMLQISPLITKKRSKKKNG